MDDKDPHIIAGMRKLCGVMGDLVEEHQRLLAALTDKREAFTLADDGTMGECIAREAAIIERIEGLDRARRQAAVGLALRLGIKPKEGDVTVAMLVERLPERAGREQLRGQSTVLRGLVQEVRKETSLIKEVGEALLTHVRGLAQRIRQAMSQTGVYGRNGRVAEAAYGVRTVDLRS